MKTYLIFDELSYIAHYSVLSQRNIFTATLSTEDATQMRPHVKCVAILCNISVKMSAVLMKGDLAKVLMYGRQQLRFYIKTIFITTFY